MQMRYLTRIEIRKEEAFANSLVDPYSWHQALWRAFPGHDNEKSSFLFRTDENETYFQIYLLSEFQILQQSWGSWQTKEISGNFLNYPHYRFQLRANPTKRLGVGNDKGKRVGIYKESNLREWFLRKAEHSGFQSRSFAVSKPMTDYFNKKGGKNKLNRVDFQGILEVMDKDKFKSAFHTGIGSAKSLGYGMLILQPIQ
jgi:CRISPR system Cascade subunit CasE